MRRRTTSRRAADRLPRVGGSSSVHLVAKMTKARIIGKFARDGTRFIKKNTFTLFMQVTDGRVNRIVDLHLSTQINDRLRHTRARLAYARRQRDRNSSNERDNKSVIAKEERFDEAYLPFLLLSFFLFFYRNSRSALRSARRRATPNEPLAGRFGERMSACLNPVFIAGFADDRSFPPRRGGHEEREREAKWN